jgi:hypothetical protein
MTKMKNIKVVIVSETGYSDKHTKLLERIRDEGYELFCAVGKQCELWEEVMDEIAVGDGENSRYITTTSHLGESEDEVLCFAKSFNASRSSGVEIIRI